MMASLKDVASRPSSTRWHIDLQIVDNDYETIVQYK
jgi:hypothetical protein